MTKFLSFAKAEILKSATIENFSISPVSLVCFYCCISKLFLDEYLLRIAVSFG
jgi:hypothetical protein